MVHFSWGASISILNKSPDFQLCNCWRNLVSSESGHKLSLNTIGWIFHGIIPWPLYCQTYLFQNCKSQNEFQLNKDSPEGLSASAQESSSWQDRPWFAEPRGCSWHSFAPVNRKWEISVRPHFPAPRSEHWSQMPWGPKFVKMSSQWGPNFFSEIGTKWGPSPAEWGPKKGMFAK